MLFLWRLSAVTVSVKLWFLNWFAGQLLSPKGVENDYGKAFMYFIFVCFCMSLAHNKIHYDLTSLLTFFIIIF